MGLFFRLYGLSKNGSFWSDEAITSIYSRAVLLRGTPHLLTGDLDDRGIGYYYLTAGFFKLLGVSEFSARLPAVFLGIGSIILIFFLAIRLFSVKVALGTAFLTTFSTAEILWSRQARWYAGSQFCLLLLLWALWLFEKSLAEKTVKIKHFNIFQLSLLAASALFLLVSSVSYELLAVVMGVYLLLNIKRFWQWPKDKKIYFIMTMLGWCLVFFLFLISSRTNNLTYFGLQFKRLNNYLSYYLVYFRHYYLIFCLLSLAGLLLNFRNKALWFLSIIIGAHLFYLSFFTAYHYVRYFLPLFPVIFLLAVSGIESLSLRLFPRHANFVFAPLLLAIFFCSGRFTFYPKPYYSLSFEFRETPETDYKGIYQKVAALRRGYPEMKIVDAHPELGEWYLGEKSISYSLKSTAIVNWYRNQGWQKDPYSGGQYVSSKAEMKNIVAQYRPGVVVLEYTEAGFLPRDLVDYIERDLEPIVKYDSLFHDNDPRGWPILLAGWGFEKKDEAKLN